MKKILLAGMLLAGIEAFAQDDSTGAPLTVSGYLEAYYTYDLGRPSNHNRPSFIYSHNRHNEVNLNLGLVKAAYERRNVRANLALAAGTYI
ncbi:outer membrane beta-barrel protein [Niabella hibiscisoli]|uniref:outer membrane beta-barrel protein n=1 Tax=Niabella hibiscisoli TaxID=1825928 RepID=UPI00374D05F3